MAAWVKQYDKETLIELDGATALSVGDICGIDSSGYAAKADADGTVRRPIGVVISGCSAAGSKVTLAKRAIIDGLSSITPGAEQYLSTTAGGRTQTISTTAPVIRVGKGLTSTSVEYDFQGQITLKKKWLYTDFQGFLSMGGPTGVSDGTAAARNTFIVEGYGPNNPIFMENIPNVGQTILGPARHASGINISQDLTDNDGVEYCFGDVYNRDNPAHFKVGTDGAFYAKAKLLITDVSGTDDLAFGFRKIEARQAAIDDYDEMAALNVISGDIKIETILNGGATTTTDTTDNWADTNEKTLEIYVSAAGVVTYKIDGAAPTVTAAFTFDNGECVMPFLYLLHASDVAETTVWETFECGLQTGEVD